MDPYLRNVIYRIKRDWQTAGQGIKRALICLVVGCLPCLLLYTGLSEAIEPFLLRQWFSIRGDRKIPASVTIVRFDKPAYAKIGLSPGEMFPRKYIAEGIERITGAGAKLIVLDAFFQRVGDDEASDAALADALAGSPSVIGRYTETLIDTDAQGRQKRTRITVRPIDRFAQSAKAVIPLQVRVTNGRVEEICLANERDAIADMNVPLLRPLHDFVSAGVEEPGGFDFINFYGGPSALTSISFGELLGGESHSLRDYFEGRVVLVGSASDTGAGITAGKDTFITSVSSLPMYGVEIHATIAANLLDKSWIRRIRPQTEALLLGLVGFGSTFAILSVGAMAALAVGIGTVVAWLTVSYFCFVELFYFVPGLSLSVGLIPAVVILRWAMLAVALADRE